MPLVSPTAIAGIDMLANDYYPDCDYLKVHAVDIAAGGRVLTVAATGPTLADARAVAYRNVQRIHFSRCHCRRDIAAPAQSPPRAEPKGGPRGVALPDPYPSRVPRRDRHPLTL